MRQSVQLKIIYNSEIIRGSAKNIDLNIQDLVVANTDQGPELARVLSGPKEFSGPEDNKKIIKIIRVATEEDLSKVEENNNQKEETFALCREKISKHKLPMKLVTVHHFLEGNKIIFYFTSEGRVDFRNLVKELASVFRSRIELRQIGVRDEAQILGGQGVCGRCLCCNVYKPMTQPVSIKMAKEQNLALNSSKISGTCGRLLCCLGYEYGTYKELNKKFPHIGSKVWIGEKKCVVKDINIQTGLVKLMDEDHHYSQHEAETIKINKISGKKYIELVE